MKFKGTVLGPGKTDRLQFEDDNSDPTLILAFTREREIEEVDLVHLDVPDHDYTSVVDGCDKYSWIPWQRYPAQT